MYVCMYVCIVCMYIMYVCTRDLWNMEGNYSLCDTLEIMSDLF